MAYIDYQDIRQLNAFEYLTRFEGFSVSPKTNKSWLSSHDPHGSAVIEHINSGTTFLVSRDAQHTLEYRITTTDGTRIQTGRSSASKVDLLSFVAWLYREDFKAAAARISANIPKLKSSLSTIQASSTAKTFLDQHSQKQLSDRVRKHTGPLQDPHYLQKRGIASDIINDPLFSSRIGTFKLGSTIENLCFNCYNSNDQFVTTCQRYFYGEKAIKQFPYFKDPSGINLSPSSNGSVWRSNSPKSPSFLLISESPEDAMAYYQLHHSLLKDKTLIVSSLGNFRQDQATVISELAKQHNIDKFILANDNDAAGIRFDLMALCAISAQAASICPIAAASLNLITNEQHKHVNKLHYHFEFLPQHFDFANEFFAHLDKALINNQGRLAFSEGLYKSDQNVWTFDLYCKNDMIHTEDIQQILFVADKSNYFKQHFIVDKPYDLIKTGEDKRSQIKDWNEFLIHFNGNLNLKNQKLEFLTQKNDDSEQSIEKKKNIKIN